MNKVSTHSKAVMHYPPLAWFLAGAFLLWCVMWFGFLRGDYMLLGDAQAYYEHFRFFVDQMSKGVYPLWDPSRQRGVPMEFFLRRIGSYNPLFLMIVLLYKAGLPFWYAYFGFLAGYYFLGMLGVFHIARELFRDIRPAFAVFAGLMFSSIASLLFNSFIILEFTPMVWFLYCALRFARSPQRVFFWGMTFTTMILLTTYLPFYFITIFGSLFLIVAPMYGSRTLAAAKVFWGFLVRHPRFAFLCTILVISALVPGFLMFREMGTGHLVMPMRHAGSDDANVLAVARQTTAKGGVVLTHFWEELFIGLENIKVGNFYIPIAVHVLFLMGCIARAGRPVLVLGFWAFFIYLMSVYHASPVYRFLYEHVFYFKYFRNFQFFLWLVLLPVYVILAGGHIKSLINRRGNAGALAAFLGLIHAVLIYYLYSRGDSLWSSYAVLTASLIFWLVFVWRGNQGRTLSTGAVLFAILVLMAVQPLQVYSYLHQNHTRGEWEYRYDHFYLDIDMPDRGQVARTLAEAAGRQRLSPEVFLAKNPDHVYLGTSWYVFLRGHLNLDLLSDYLGAQFLLYDQVQPSSFPDVPADDLRETFMALRNVALVDDAEPIDVRRKTLDEGRGLPDGTNAVSGEQTSHVSRLMSHVDSRPSSHVDQVRIVAAGDPDLYIRYRGVNDVILVSRLRQGKFLVHNETYYPGWRVAIDGERVPLYRANVAFRGVWIPPGEHEIHFRYGSRWRYLLDYGLYTAFLGFFLYGLYLIRGYRRQEVSDA